MPWQCARCFCSHATYNFRQRNSRCLQHKFGCIFTPQLLVFCHIFAIQNIFGIIWLRKISSPACLRHATWHTNFGCATPCKMSSFLGDPWLDLLLGDQSWLFQYRLSYTGCAHEQLCPRPILERLAQLESLLPRHMDRALNIFSQMIRALALVLFVLQTEFIF